MEYIWFIIAGLISGVIGGMGMGGGTLLIPILTIFLGVMQRTAQGLNLLVFIPMSVVALIIHCKNKLVDFKVGLIIIGSGVVASVAGSLLALNLSNGVLQKIFGVFLLLVGIWQIIETVISCKKSKKQKPAQFKIITGFKFK